MTRITVVDRVDQNLQQLKVVLCSVVDSLGLPTLPAAGRNVCPCRRQETVATAVVRLAVYEKLTLATPFFLTRKSSTGESLNKNSADGQRGARAFVCSGDVASNDVSLATGSLSRASARCAP